MKHDKMTIKAIFLDIDGTLVSFKTHKIPQSTLDALAAVRSRGIKVFIATGRPVLYINNLTGLEHDGMVTTTGAYCTDRYGNVIQNKSIPKTDLMRVVDHIERNPDDNIPIIFVSTQQMFLSHYDASLENIANLLNIRIPEVRNIRSALNMDVLQMIAFFPIEKQKYFMEELMPECSAMRWHPAFADIIAKGVSKSAGIDALLAHEGISLKETMAFGDGGNDIDMLKHVGCGIAMGNASDAVKQAADYVTQDIDDDGVFHALKHFELI